MHNDDKYRELSRPKPNGQSLWVQLLYGPSTIIMPGLLPVGLATIADELQWPLAGTKRAWEEIAALGMAKADLRGPLIWLPNALKHNPPQSPNVVRAWRGSFDDDIPPCALKAEAERHARAFLEVLGKAFLEAFARSCGKEPAHPLPEAVANQDQDQDQDQVHPDAVGALRESPRGAMR